MSDGKNGELWRKSSYSGSGDCLEWLIDTDEVRVRDATRGASGELHLSYSQWRAFLTAVKAGEADLPDA